MKLSDFKVLTFDCYGTLIDWESGIYRALEPLLQRLGSPQTRDQVLESYAQHEASQEQLTPGMLYPQVLSYVYKRLANEWEVHCTNEEANIFGASVPDWPEFSDSVRALRHLKQHHKLVILSNVDRLSFRSSNARLQVVFDAIVTAQDIGVYKPDPHSFEYLVQVLDLDFGVTAAETLHVAQSVFHDHEPASKFGFATAWIDRGNASKEWEKGMPPAGTPKFDFTFASLDALVLAHQAEIDI